jgi:hypothetical protein
VSDDRGAVLKLRRPSASLKNLTRRDSIMAKSKTALTLALGTAFAASLAAAPRSTQPTTPFSWTR